MSTAMRTPAKVQTLRAHEIDGGDKSAGSQTHLARAVTLHLAGKREEALKQLQRAIAANGGIISPAYFAECQPPASSRDSSRHGIASARPRPLVVRSSVDSCSRNATLSAASFTSNSNIE